MTQGRPTRQESGVLAFNPPTDAEPSSCEAPANGEPIGEVEVPTVLTKLQKWADYPSVGNPVCPTNFLPMKTPMSLEILSNWSLEAPPRHSLTVPELLAGQAAAGRRVGMIIDLANHECLYAENLPEDLEYTHIQLVAKVLPPREAIDEVAAAAGEFWARRPGDFIAIHCAYGFNRTGFVVCSYLVQVCGLTVPEALASFAEARPPGVKHGKFVDELYARYGGREEAAEAAEGAEGAAGTPPRSGGGAASGAAPPTPTGLLALQLRRQGSGSAAGSAAELSRAGSGGCASSLVAAAPSLAGTSASDEGYPSTVPQSASPSASSASGSAHPGLSRRQSASRQSSSRSLLGDAGARPLSAVAEGASGTITSGHLAPEEPAAEEHGGGGEAAGGSGPRWSAMAQHLDGKSLMRRETSMGLAKALHEDFGVHESTPSRADPSPLAVAAAAEGAAEEDAGDVAAVRCSEDLRARFSEDMLLHGGPEEEAAAEAEATGSEASPPAGDAPAASTPGLPHLSPRPPLPPRSAGTPPSSSPPGGGAAAGRPPPPPPPPWNPIALSLARKSPLVEPEDGADMPRNVSFESDCHSLGFNAREAMQELRAEDGRRRASLDPGMWEVPPEPPAGAPAKQPAAAATGARGGGAAAAAPPGQDRKASACSLM